MSDKYQLIGHIYDALATVYSGNKINQCKTAMHNQIKPGDKILFAGVGHGYDAIQAIEIGAEVTVVDLSETMLNKFRKKLDTKNKSISNLKIIHDNIFDFKTTDEGYDMVFGNFFLNVFSENMMKQVIDHLIELIKPGGHLVIGDFVYPETKPIRKFIQNLNWYIADLLFVLFSGNAFHPVYNYPEYLKKCGLKIENIKPFDLFSVNLYWSICARKC